MNLVLFQVGELLIPLFAARVSIPLAAVIRTYTAEVYVYFSHILQFVMRLASMQSFVCLL